MYKKLIVLACLLTTTAVSAQAWSSITRIRRLEFDGEGAIVLPETPHGTGCSNAWVAPVDTLSPEAKEQFARVLHSSYLADSPIRLKMASGCNSAGQAQYYRVIVDEQ